MKEEVIKEKKGEGERPQEDNEEKRINREEKGTEKKDRKRENRKSKE